MKRGKFWDPFPLEELQFRCLRYWTTIPGDIDGHHEARRDELSSAVDRLLRKRFTGFITNRYCDIVDEVLVHATEKLLIKLMRGQGIPAFYGYVCYQIRGAAKTIRNQRQPPREGFSFEQIFLDQLTESEIRRPVDGKPDHQEPLLNALQHFKLEPWEQSALGGLLADVPPEGILCELRDDFPHIAAQLTEADLTAIPNRLHARIRQMVLDGAKISKSQEEIIARTLQTFDLFTSGMRPSEVADHLNVPRVTTTRDLNRLAEWIAGARLESPPVVAIRDFLDTWRRYRSHPQSDEVDDQEGRHPFELPDQFRSRLLDCLKPDDWRRTFLEHLHEPEDDFGCVPLLISNHPNKALTASQGEEFMVKTSGDLMRLMYEELGSGKTQQSSLH